MTSAVARPRQCGGAAVLRTPDPQLPLRVPGPPLGTRRDGPAHGKDQHTRRRAEFITPIPKPKKRKAPKEQSDLELNDAAGLSTKSQRYDPTPIINELRQRVDTWRGLPNPSQWLVTPETQRLLQHWRHHRFSDVRPFFCQIEAVETAIWLTEVAPQTKDGKRFLDWLNAANANANPGLNRLALKLATGAGKTTVMAMLVAWQTVNAVRRPGSKRFTRGFLVVTPGLTIKDRLRVLQPNDPDSYYESRELVPGDMLGDVRRAKIVITNYHAFKLRETLELAKGNRALLQGRGPEIKSLETEGQMLQRVMPELMRMRDILVLNDEAHHCYRSKPPDEDEEGDLKGEERKEAEKNEEAARLWISGLETVTRKLGVHRVMDLSATPFFLRGSGYAEGTLFPWTMSDFSLMDSIECGIVKLPRVPVADNIPGSEMPNVPQSLGAHWREDAEEGARQGCATRAEEHGQGNLFVIFGEPDIDILPEEAGQIRVKIIGVDVFHPNTGEVRSDGPDGIACWFIDTDYNEESFFVRHAYFLGANDPYKALKTTLKAEIDEDAWQSLHSAVSRPFDKPKSGRIAVKVINHLGDEVMKVFRVE